MNTNPNNKKSTPASIHPATQVGHVSLTVANLENQISFYQNVLGFSLHWRNDQAAHMGSGSANLLHLVEKPNVKRYQRVTGLYHFAVLFPDQRELARAVARLFALKYQNFPTDHVLTKTTYLDDPEGNGIELYADSPEDGQWFMEGDNFFARRADGTLSNGREPLDLEELFSHLKEDDRLDAPIPKETCIGHVHLHTRDVDEAVDFYHGLLGFDIMGQAKAMRIAFVSAGGYHHHVGLNTWQGEGAPPPPPDAMGLRYFSVVLPNQTELDKLLARLDQAGIPMEERDGGLLVVDPSQNGLLLVAQNTR
jgi:catechol 2,3-dioxygenase